MQCSITGCTGEVESTTVVHTVQHNGRPLVIEDVPAEVCSVCGDILFHAETVRCIEQLLTSLPQPVRTVPAFTFPLGEVSGEPTVQ